MKSVYRWLSEYAGFAKILLFLLLSAFTFYAATLEHISFLAIYLLDLLIWFFAGRIIALAPAKLLEEPLRIMDQQCDPHPFLEESNRQLQRSKPSSQQQMILINQATGLRLLGENYRALQILENINIDRFPSTTPYIKFVYYTSLSDVLFSVERKSEAIIWHKKAAQIYADLPPVQAEKFYGQTMRLSEAVMCFHQGDCEEALKKVTWMECDNTRHLLSAALLAAKCHIALEEPDKAREKLQYVINRGNKLHIVQEAAEILESLN